MSGISSSNNKPFGPAAAYSLFSDLSTLTTTLAMSGSVTFHDPLGHTPPPQSNDGSGASGSSGAAQTSNPSAATSPSEANSPGQTQSIVFSTTSSMDGFPDSAAATSNPTSAALDPSGQNGPPGAASKQTNGVSPGTIAAAVIIPLIIISASCIAAFCWLKKRRSARNRRSARALPAAEMKMRRSESSAVRYSMPPTEPPPPAVTSGGQNPIIIAPTQTRAYYTGIDTSDEVSMHSHVAPSNNFSTNGEHDPPPPYRPRSIAGPPPISRETSMRTVRYSAAAPPTDATSLIGRTQQLQETDNPFADPGDDDAVSVLSSHSRGHNERGSDRLSEVSDLSYQDEPTTAHHAV